MIPFHNCERVFMRATQVALAVGFALGMTGCGEDTKVHPLPPGTGTLESPYLIQADLSYTEIPVHAGGTVFMIAEGVGADWYGLTTKSSADINLAIAGFESFMGAPDRPIESATPGKGSENLEILGDGDSTDLFFTIDGTHIRAKNQTFNVKIEKNSAPGAVTLTIPPCLAPGPACADPMSGAAPVVMDLPFALAPKAKLSVTLTNTFGAWVFLRAMAAPNEGGGYVNFPANDFVYGDGFCHVNSGAATGSSETCKINPIPDNPAPASLRLANNMAAADALVTLTFRSR